MEISYYFSGDVKILQLMGLMAMGDIFRTNKRLFNDKKLGFLIFAIAYIGMLYGLFYVWRKAINMRKKDIMIAIETFSVACTVTLGMFRVEKLYNLYILEYFLKLYLILIIHYNHSNRE